MTNLATILSDSARRTPEAVALRLQDRRHSYAQLDALSAGMAEDLGARGVRAGQRVALIAPNLPQMTVAYYAVLRLGAVVVPLNPLLTARELEALFRSARLSAVMADESVAGPSREAHGRLPEPIPFLEIGARTMGAADPAGPPRPPVGRADDDLAVLLFTSGTTGAPKGAALTHDNLLSNAWMTTRMFSYVPEDVILGSLPFFHVFGQTVTLNASIAVGAQISLVPSFQPRAVLHQIREHGVTAVIGVPSMYMGLNTAQRRQRVSTPRLRAGISGGAALPAEVLREFEELFGVSLYEGYGLSETSPVVAFNHPVDQRQPGSIGTACEFAELRVIDDEGREVPRGEVGELAVAGRFVMKGYWDQPALTEQAFAGRYFRTGDMARHDDQGRFWIVDRKKDTILHHGYNVYPREIEELLYDHPQVEEAAVVGRGAGATSDQEIVACLVLREDAQAQEVIRELRASAREGLATYKRPHDYRIMASLPKGSTGKILKREIDPSV